MYYEYDGPVRSMVKEMGWAQITDPTEIEDICRSVLEDEVSVHI